MAKSKKGSRALIIAAEASSSLYGLRLLEYWKKNKIPVSAFGIGSQAMADYGFDCLGRAEDLAVVGIQEIISHWSEIKNTFNKILEECKRNPPDFALLMDYPEFNMRLAGKLKAMNIPVVYFISPQIWAWREYRVEKIKKYITKMLVLFPFEVDFYKKHGVQVEFVGHPLLDELDNLLPDFIEKNKIKNKLGFSENDILIGLMPGSRKSEVKHNFSTQLESAALVRKKIKGSKICVLVAPTLDEEYLKSFVKNHDVKFIKQEPFKMIALMDYIICASGTATLMVGLAQVPFIVMYKMNWLSAFVAKKLVKGVNFFAMVNLIMDKEVVPERFQESASPLVLSDLILELHEKKYKKELMLNSLKEMRLKLGTNGAIERVARSLMEFMDSK